APSEYQEAARKGGKK
ncbi:TPA: KGG domain-containing protein, partial [Escherichia coli]